MTRIDTNIRSIAIAVAGVFLGCCLNALFLEYLVKCDPGAGTMVTFGQYLFIAIEGFINTYKFGTAKRYIPFKSYLTIVATFFTCNVLNNYVFDFNISMPLHMIFRSGSLITNMAMCIIILKKSYPLMKYFSVCLITVGVMICTIVTGQEVSGVKGNGMDVESSFFWWIIGVLILVFALFASSLLGIYQERLYKKFGKHPDEALFFTHLIPLPAFLLLYNNIKEHFIMALNSPPLVLPVINYAIPETLLYAGGNIITQYICIKSVYKLTTEASSLSCTLALTLRKFISLLISILYFDNGFKIGHWIGTLCVFVGTLLFTELLQLFIHEITRKKATKVTKRSKKKKSS
ncbi:UDP-xylose and UDP-N-acetylglucosamine transporter isoform X2 [Halyomorpha halys]|uniref:UDP-xylose and UDP-N-acetylglucosamine transporter isoform X2 n=1 Tax=Halyomorpha halys TaxID=286706 RepID=UPI0006D4ED03|nr:UDP-xylose and UDP-N-acetylglucosamine transporter-like isoform X2 [Halyomorpha halys]